VSLFPKSVYEVVVGAEQGMLDDGFDPVIVAYVWPSSLLLNIVVLSVKILF